MFDFESNSESAREVFKSDFAAKRLQEVRDRERTVLVVDDETLLLAGVRRALRRMGFSAVVAETARDALNQLEAGLRPDVIITDQRMPGMSGTEMLAIIRERYPSIVRVCMSGHADRPEILESINRGSVFRFLMKPWDLEEFQRTVQSSMKQADLIAEHRLLNNVMTSENRDMKVERKSLLNVVTEQSVAIQEKNARLEQSIFETVKALVEAIEAKDAYTAGHSELVSRFAVALGEELHCNNEQLECLRLAGILHDVGKIGVPDSVLLKPGRLTPEEFEVVRAHPEIGERILKDVRFPYDILPIVRLHHERWDGLGYPDKLAGEDIPMLARLTHIVDVYEAITARRVYREPMPVDRVIQIFERGAGADFDPNMVPAFLSLLHNGTFDRIREQAECSVVQRVGDFTFRMPPKVELRED